MSVLSLVRRVALAAVLASGACRSVTPRDSSSALTSPAITPEDLRRRLEIIADDSTEGRSAGSPGALRAQRYVEAELRRLGIAPGGEHGRYTQALRTVIRRAGASELSVDGGARFELWRDYLPLPWPWMSRPIEGAPVV